MKRNLFDRGMKKWTAMMLPEHIELLREWRDEDAAQVRPELSSWELKDLQDTIVAAYTAQSIVTIWSWENGGSRQYEGVILSIDPMKKVLYLQDPFTVEVLALGQIMRVES